MDDNNQVVQALAITGDRILAVGSNAEIKKRATAQTEMIDVGGRTIIPGLIDARLHAIRGGQTYLFETYWYDATSLKSALDELKTTAAKRGPGKWVTVAGSWSPAQFEENRAPSVEDLNAALPSNPAYVQYLYDYAILNDKGMEALEDSIRKGQPYRVWKSKRIPKGSQPANYLGISVRFRFSSIRSAQPRTTNARKVLQLILPF